MASAKDEQRFERRKKELQKRIGISVIVVVFIIASGIAINRMMNREPVENDNPVTDIERREWDPNSGKNIVAVIDGIEITEAEFMYYFFHQVQIIDQAAMATGIDIWEQDLDGQTAEEFAKYEALKRIRQVKESVRRSREMDVYPTDSEVVQAEEMAAYEEDIKFADEMVQRWGLNENAIYNCLIEITVQKALFEHLTAEITITTPEQEAELQRIIDEETEFRVQTAMENEGDDFIPFSDAELQGIVDRMTNEYLIKLRNEYFENLSSEWVEGIDIIINHEFYDPITASDAKVW